MPAMSSGNSLVYWIHYIRVYGVFVMRVYTDTTLQAIIGYGKLLLGVVILVVMLSQAMRIWGNDPAVQQIKELLQSEQAEQP
mgnify:CR=1 FL=1